LQRRASGQEIVLVISDTHAPYHHPDVFDFLRDAAKEFKPTRIVHIGDEVDWHSLSVHEKEPKLLSAGDEYKASLAFMHTMYKLFPVVSVCISNHGSRVFRAAKAIGIPDMLIRSYREQLEAPRGWHWEGRIVIDGVCYEHGDPGSGRNAAFKAAMENRMSTVIGHTHGWGGVQYSANPFSQVFALNVGCLVDHDSLAFKYGEKYRNKCTLGCGVVIEGKIAHFVRMPT
jgi:hypothetical protein